MYNVHIQQATCIQTTTILVDTIPQCEFCYPAVFDNWNTGTFRYFLFV